MDLDLAERSPTFPTEIFESILYYSSYSTLLTTSFVNSTFHLITRKYLFNSISLKRTVYDRDTVSRARTFLSLLDYIPDIANCVRRIHINCVGLELSDGFVPDTTPLIAVLSRLPSLNSISLRGTNDTRSPIYWLDWSKVCVELRQAFARTFRSPLMSEIKLSHIDNLSLLIFVGCHSLKHLSFNTVSSRIPSQNVLVFRPRLKSLILRWHSFPDGLDDETDLKRLFSLQGLFDISQLDKFVFSGGSHIVPAHILSLCAESIKSLELRMDTSVRGTYSIITPSASESAPLPPSPIELDILINLTKLIIVAKLTETGDFSYMSPLPWLVARLETLTSASKLSEIILQLNLSVTDNILKAINWADLTRVLSSKNLNLVTLKVSGQYTPLSPAKWAVLRENQHLSSLVDDGRLVLVNSTPP